MKNKINMSKAPYKGIYSEVAKELDVKPQAVRQAVVIFKNPRVIALVKSKIEERENYAKYADVIATN